MTPAVTETEMKLRDAETQLRLALAHTVEEETVRSCINSLISSTRSVTFVMQTEFSGCSDLVGERMVALNASSLSPLLRFFNEQRVYSIHRGVVVPEKITPTITEFKINGVIQPPGPRTMIFYRFDGVHDYLPASDSGGVFRLCEKYLTALRTLIGEWLAKRAELRAIPYR